MCLSGIDIAASDPPGLKLSMHVCICGGAPSLHAITCWVPHEVHQTFTLDLKTRGREGTSPDVCFRDSPSGADIKRVVFETVSQPLPVYSLFYVYKSYECAIEIDQKKMCLKNLTCLETKAGCPSKAVPEAEI